VSGDVRLGLARSGVTPVGRRRGACGSGPFPAAPGPNRTGTFQRIRLSSDFHVQFATGFRLPRARRISVTVSALCIAHTSRHPVILNRLAPSPCGRLSRPPRRGVTPATTTGPLSPWDSRPAGDPAFVPVIRASARQAPRSSPWMPSLGIAPATGGAPAPNAMRAQCRAPVSCVFPVGPSVYPGWRLGFRQSSFSHIARVPSAHRPYASARPLVSWHALVPFTFQIQVSHQTQEYPPNSSRLHRGYNRAPRGAGWDLVWY
jgi:hypothetical protein